MSQKQFDFVIFIGRFQPVHRAHMAVIEKAAKLANNIIVMIGSSGQARDPKNPFTWQERAQMIKNAKFVGQNDVYIQCVPIYDERYNDTAWITRLQQQVAIATSSIKNPKIALIGHKKDNSSYYLDLFPQWKYIPVDSVKITYSDGSILKRIDATEIRERIFSTPLHQELQKEDYKELFSNTVNIINNIRMYSRVAADGFAKVQSDWKYIVDYKRSWEAAPYAPTFVTCDAVVVQSGHVLLIKRGGHPGLGLYALPGGFLDGNERIVDGIIRELREETRLKVPEPVIRGSVKDVHVFDDPGRSLRGRTITHAAYIVLADGYELPKVKGSDDAAKAEWVPIADIINMRHMFFEDHYHIIKYFCSL